MLRLILGLLAALAVAAPAQAATFSMEGSVLVYTGAGIEENDAGGYTDMFDSVHVFTLSGPAPVTDVGDTGCSLEAGNYECPRIGVTRIAFRGGEGDDDLGGAFDVPQTVDGGPGDDLLDGGTPGDVLLGGGGDDWLRGNGGPDDIQGGTGTDRLEGGTGGDALRGGDGVDVANYFYGSGVTVTIDGVANDGDPGENDNVLTDVEDLWGSPQADHLTGSSGANGIEGGLGGDTITGGGGRDDLAGEDGNDTIFARDGIGEPVDCGSGVDTAEVDDVDGEPSDCETVSSSNALQPDLDHDGVDRPADCDDADPLRRPGLFDVPENGRDEDCSGADAPQLDRDGDAFDVPRDCDDGDAAIHPGAREVPGNAADENCDGRAQAFPSVGVTVGDAWSVRRGAARVARLVIDGMRAGTRVQLRCEGKGCPFKRKGVEPRKGRRTLALQRRLKGLALRRGTVLELWVTRPETIGTVVRFTGRRRGLPARRQLCAPPGATVARRCA